jgi:hypothetical protein
MVVGSIAAMNTSASSMSSRTDDTFRTPAATLSSSAVPQQEQNRSAGNLGCGQVRRRSSARMTPTMKGNATQ